MKKIIPAFLAFFLFFPLNLHSKANETGRGRYFLEGDGILALVSSHSGRRINAQYRKKDGSYDEAVLKQINGVFGLNPALGEDVSLRLISMLDYLQDKYTPGRALSLLSGYRSPSYNANLRKKGRLAAKTSYHMEGMAADVIFQGVSSKTVWEYVRSLDCCGVGMYNGASVHVDAGKPRFWTSETALPKTDEPPQNKNIYLSVDKDIYLPGERVKMFFSGISDFPFGIRPTFKLKDGDRTLQSFNPTVYNTRKIADNCLAVEKRADARFLSWDLPADVKTGNDKLGIEVEFCGHDFERMPEKVLSREFQVK